MSDGRLTDGPPPAAEPTDVPPPEPTSVHAEPGEAAPSLLQLPRVLRERYTIVEELPARGSEADLLVVEDREQPDTTRVVKLYRPPHEVDSEVLEMLRGHGGLAHIPEILDYGHGDGRSYEVLEHIRGGDLRGFQLRHGPAVDASLVREVLQELADAVEHLHELNLSHRDLKPDNILVRHENELDLVLADFGLAGISEATLVFGAGTARSARYAAPEVLSGTRGRAEDVWALGVVTAELLLGDHPLGHLEPERLSHHLQYERWPIRPTTVTGAAWQRLLGGMLIPEPEHRWSIDHVQRWLADDTDLPPPWVAPGERAETAHGFVFEGQVLTSRAEIARALVTHWPQGASRVQHGALRAWLAHPNVDDPELEAYLDELADSPWDRHGRLLRLSLRLNPELSPWYRGYSVSLEGLADLAADAVRDGPGSAADELVASLRDQQVLTAIADLTGSPEHAHAGHQWHHARQRLRRLLDHIDQLPSETRQALADRGDARLLQLVVDHDERHRLEQLADGVRGGQLVPEWFRALRGPDAGPAELLVASALADEARAQVRAARLERRAQRATRAADVSPDESLASWLAARSALPLALLAGAVALRWPVPVAVLALLLAGLDVATSRLSARLQHLRQSPPSLTIGTVVALPWHLLGLAIRFVGACLRSTLVAGLFTAGVALALWLGLVLLEPLRESVETLEPHTQAFYRWLVPAVVAAAVWRGLQINRPPVLPAVRRVGIAARLAPAPALVALWAGAVLAGWLAVTNPAEDPWAPGSDPVDFVQRVAPSMPDPPGWISELTQPPEDAPSGEPTGPREPVVWEVVGAAELNVRARPGTDADVVHRLTKGQTRPGTGEQAEAEGAVWVELELSEGRTGWSSTRYLEAHDDG